MKLRIAVILALAVRVGCAAETPTLLGRIPVGPGEAEIAYRSGGAAGVGFQPSEVFIDERAGIIVVADVGNRRIKLFNLEDCAYRSGFALDVPIEAPFSIAALEGILFLQDGMTTIHAFTYDGKMLMPIRYRSSGGMPVFAMRGSIVYATEAGDALSYPDGKPFRQGPEGNGVLRRFVDSARVMPELCEGFAFANDFFGRTFSSDGVNDYLVQGFGSAERRMALFGEREYQALKMRNARVTNPLEQLAGSGIVYYMTVWRDGLSVYRYIPPTIKGGTFLRLSFESSMSAVARDGLPDPIPESMKLLKPSLMPEELKAFRNSVLAAKGYAFPEEDLYFFFASFDWYRPNVAVKDPLALLSPAQRRAWDFFASR